MGILQIADLRIHCVVGVHTRERERLQELLLDVEIELPFAQAAATDRISHTVDYAAVARRLESWAQARKFKLLETLAERACELILGEWPQARRCRVTVKKPGAIPSARYAAAIAERRTG